MPEEKTLSKKEQKRLAKKAQKEAAKGGEQQGDGKGKNSKAPEATKQDPSSIAPKKTSYYLAHASKDCTSTLKAAVASIAYDVKLSCAPPSLVSSMPSFFSGAALVSSSTSSTVAFGGNGITKAIGLISATSDESKDSVLVEEFLELERTTLRSACSKKARKTGLDTIEKALSDGSGCFLVGDSLTAADIATVVTLSSQEPSGSAVIQAYLDMHNSSDIFIQGNELAEELLPLPEIDLENDPSLMKAVNSVFYKAISSITPAGIDVPKMTVEKSKKLEFGDYQCKEAMPLFPQIKAAGSLPPGVHSPKQLAEAIVKSIPEDNPVVDSFEINGPGFILCKVKASHLEGHLNKMMNSAENGKDPKVPLPDQVEGKGDVVVVDFSSPNIAKEMHVGHLRSTIIGESCCRILELIGADVKRVNHVGDWGTQFGMLITYLKEAYPNFGDDNGEGANIGDLTQFYKKAKARFDEDAEFKKVSQLNVVKLQAGDEECRSIWQTLCDISRKEFEKVYKRLDITLEECGESFYNDKIPPVIEEFEKGGHISIETGGAKCVFVPKYKVPLMLQKSDGGFGYDSTDMAALKYRLQGLGASRIVCITDFSQGDHFSMCFSAAEKIGWVDSKKHNLQHIGFGTVMGEDGKRFKTRSGDTVRLVDLLDEAVERMEKSLYERIEEGKANITKEQVPEVAAAMGYGAVKYFDLRRNPTSNYKFSYDQMLDTKGNTAIYLLYAHARLESICSNGKKNFDVDVDKLITDKSAKIVLGDPAERNLALHIQMYSDMIEDLLKDLYPYRICDFLYALSNAVSNFVTKCKVIGSPEMESRLLLCRASAVVMRQCFDLLAIRHVNSI